MECRDDVVGEMERGERFGGGQKESAREMGGVYRYSVRRGGDGVIDQTGACSFSGMVFPPICPLVFGGEAAVTARVIMPPR